MNRRSYRVVVSAIDELLEEKVEIKDDTQLIGGDSP